MLEKERTLFQPR